MVRTFLAIFALMAVLSACSNVGNKTTTQINVIAPTVAARPVPSPGPVALPLGAILPCSEETRVASVTGPQLPIRYVNATGKAVSILWLDQSGNRKAYGTIDPGKSQLRPGSATSYWLIADAAQRCIGIVHPGRETQTILVRTAAAGPELVAPREVPLVVPSDTERALDKTFSLNEDCSAASTVVARIATQPAHGAAAIRQGNGYPNYPPGNPRSACNKHAASDVEIWYHPANGYAGDDSLSVDYVFGDGRESFTTYLITVR